MKRETVTAKQEESDSTTKRDLNRKEVLAMEPFVFVVEDSELWTSIKSFYGIDSNFPCNLLASKLLFGKMRQLFFVSEGLKNLTLNNQHMYPFIHIGVKMFSIVENKATECNYRLSQEGLFILFPFMSERIVSVTKQDILSLLSDHSVSVDQLAVTTQRKLQTIGTGGCVFLYGTKSSMKQSSSRMAVSGWKDETMCRTFLATYQRSHYYKLFAGKLLKTDDPSPGYNVTSALTQFSHMLATA